MKVLIFLLVFISCTKNRNITVIAHRGASGYLPEHTLEAVSLAHGFNVDFIEPDLVMTKDDYLIVLHDIHIDTTTNVKEVFPNKKRRDGRFYAIDLTLLEIKRLKALERFDYKTGNVVFNKRFPKTIGEFKVPTFEEYINLIQGLNHSRKKEIGIIPEIKAPEFHLKEGKDITKKTINTLRAYGFEKGGNVFIQCFWPEALKRLKNEFQTTIPLIQLIADDSWGESSSNYKEMITENGLLEISKYASGIGPWLPQIINIEGRSTGIVEKAKKYNLKIFPYTHRKEQVLEKFKNSDALFDKIFNELKVDGIFSDFPDLVIKWLDK